MNGDRLAKQKQILVHQKRQTFNLYGWAIKSKGENNVTLALCFSLYYPRIFSRG